MYIKKASGHRKEQKIYYTGNRKCAVVYCCFLIKNKIRVCKKYRTYKDLFVAKNNLYSIHI